MEEIVVGIGQGAENVAVGCRGRCQICKCFGGVCDKCIQDIGGLVEAAVLGCVLLYQPFVFMRQRKVDLKIVSCVLNDWALAPFLACILEYASVE